ncbi:RrF2 family transcriptional regulator [Flintibacter muris]|uniref:RrF2 family transcriptional regulator n=1 Tax=Flintibacter muris TaxID=2941327 RepID=UPI00203FD2A0|nr:Rrf2 family transcriptional regulator [Flintibacter muris]
MLISTKGRYALRVMIDLAEHQTESFIPLKVIAQRQEISEKYLENIIKLLVKAKLLNGLRGKGGGYQLTKTPEQYTVGTILRLTEESLAPVTCLEEGASACTRMSECRTLPLWQGLNKVINDYLDHITIADLMRQGEIGDNYVI